MLVKILTSIFILAIFYTNSFASVVSGKVTTTANKVVKHAQIKFVSQQDTNIYFTTITDTLGEYVISLTTGVTEPKTNTESFQLHQNYPNPFSEQTTISYQIRQPLSVVISIYNILGQRIRTFQVDNYGQGIGRVQWDGRDELGKKVASGIYFYTMKSGDKKQVRKMLFMENIMIGDGGNFTPGKSETYSRDINLLYTEELYEDTAKVYKVYIENTENTQPTIEPVMGDKVTIAKDTVLNFTVLDATPGVWHYLGLGREDVESIAVHPYNPDIIYAGTAFDFSAGHMGKLFKTMNGGRSWDTLLVGLPVFGFRDIDIDPVYPETVYTCPLPVLKSTNGGKTWFEVINGMYITWERRASSLVIDPLSTNILYCGTGGFGSGRFYKSTNGGDSWLIKGDDVLRSGNISLAIDPNNSSIIYVGTDMVGELWKTTDAGETWTMTGLGETNQMINDILINPFNTQIVYAAISGWCVWKTEDGGNTWVSYNEGIIMDTFRRSAVKFTIRKKSSEVYVVIAGLGNPGIYKRTNYNEPWIRIGIDVISDYAYSDVKFSIDENTLYFGGSRGLYYLKFQ